MKPKVTVLSLMIIIMISQFFIDDEKQKDYLRSHNHTLFIVFMLLNGFDWIKDTIDLCFKDLNRRLDEQQEAIEKMRCKHHENNIS